MDSNAFQNPGQKIVVIGATGSGKTTFAQNLGKVLGYRVIELDAIHWLPDWQEAEWDDIRSQVDEMTNQPGWVCDGNYHQVRNVLWPKADTLIWLNYPFLVVLARLFKRSLVRVFGRVELWNGNRESFGSLFFQRIRYLFGCSNPTRATRKSTHASLPNPSTAICRSYAFQILGR